VDHAYRERFVRYLAGIRRAVGSLIERSRRQVFPYEDVTVSFGERSAVLRGFRGDHITRSLRQNGAYEPGLLQHILRRYGKQGCYVDVGAFIGTHTLFFALACQADSVLAIEPNPRAYRLLLRNVERNGADNVTAYCLALADRSGRCRIKNSPGGNVGATQLESHDRGFIHMDSGDVIIRMSPKLIKIDCEGWSSLVLRGLTQTIAKHHPVLVIEPWPQAVDVVQDLLRGYGYRCVAEFNWTPTYVFE
jgi:FkbM family methyltransferase